MLRAAVSYPLRGDRPVDRLLVGGGLHLLAAFLPLVPYVLVLGYLLRALEDASGSRRGEADPPPWRPVVPLVRRGLGGALVVAAFLAVPVALLAGTLLAASGGRAPTGRSEGVLFLAASTATLVAALAFAYPLPAALSNYARSGRLRAAFDGAALRRAATDARYFYAVAVGVAAGAVGLAVAEALVGVAVGFFLAFYVELVVVAAWARGLAPVLGSATD